MPRLLDRRLIFLRRAGYEADGDDRRGNRPAGRILASPDTAQKGNTGPEDGLISEIERFPQDLQDCRSSVVSFTQKLTNPLFCLIDGK